MTRHNNTKYICRSAACLDDAPCQDLKIPVPEMEDLVLQSIREHVGQREEDDAAEGIVESGTVETRTDSLEQERLTLYEAYLNGEVSLAVFKEQKEKIAERIQTAQKSRALMQEQSAREDAANKFRQIREEVSAANHLTVELCEKLVDRVFVYPDKRIEVEFK